MIIIYSETVFLPRYGIELMLCRTHGQRWWAAGTMDMIGNARQRARKRKPPGCIPVVAYAKASKPAKYPSFRATSRTKRSAGGNVDAHLRSDTDLEVQKKDL